MLFSVQKLSALKTPLEDTLVSERAGLFFLEAIVRAKAGKHWKNGKIPCFSHQPVESLNDQVKCVRGRQPKLLKHQVSQHLCLQSGASLDGVVIDSLPVPILGLFAVPNSNQPLLFGQTNHFQLFEGNDQQISVDRGAPYCIRASGQFANHRNSKLKEMTTTWYKRLFSRFRDASLLALPLELALEACFQGPS